MELTGKEMHALYAYFLNCGPISYEFHSEIHAIFRRLEKELFGPREFKPLKKVEETTND